MSFLNFLLENDFCPLLSAHFVIKTRGNVLEFFFSSILTEAFVWPYSGVININGKESFTREIEVHFSEAYVGVGKTYRL